MISTIKKYIPFARHYRPSKFSELMGQDVLVKTLNYAIKNNRLAQSYLLTGIRGVGKTSSARLIAKIINCIKANDVNDNMESCNECTNCISFDQNNHPDIIEIDAASRTGVDDVREIIESCEYKPLLGKYKFFIIDEVHMLSRSAFNALLKIVEEPPEHVIFIFATTEVQKIPLTVISRCQRYDLRRLSFNEIYDLLVKISKCEELKFEESALKLIASKSEGSARDAVSMLDQAASYVHLASNDDTINEQVIQDMLGLVSLETLVKLIKLIIANAPKETVEIVGEIYSGSGNMEHFLQGLTDFTGELVKYKTIDNYHNPLYLNNESSVIDILTGVSLSRISILWQIFTTTLHDLKHSHNELMSLEMAMIKAIYACNIPSMEQILDAEARISQDEIISLPKEERVNVDFTEFLKFCHQNKEMSLYHALLNDVEIKKLSPPEIEIVGDLPKINLTDLKKLLNSWKPEKWQIIKSQSKEYISLKKAMLDKVKEAEDYRIIKKYFPDANISDIILK